jgi:hypothetical protein
MGVCGCIIPRPDCPCGNGAPKYVYKPSEEALKLNRVIFAGTDFFEEEKKMTVGKHKTKGPEEKAAQRAKVWEMYKLGMSNRDISRIMGISDSNTSTIIKRMKMRVNRATEATALTMRDEFAIAALTGIISQSLSAGHSDRAKLAYQYADSMMEARNAK